MRAGNHRDFGRLVFDVPPGTHYRMSRDGDRVAVRFVPARSLTAAPGLPRNVRALEPDAQGMVVLVAPGATTHDMRLGNHVVLDVFDPSLAPAKSPRADPAQPAAASARDPAHPRASPAARGIPGKAARAEPRAGPHGGAPTATSAPTPVQPQSAGAEPKHGRQPAAKPSLPTQRDIADAVRQAAAPPKAAAAKPAQTRTKPEPVEDGKPATTAGPRTPTGQPTTASAAGTAPGHSAALPAPPQGASGGAEGAPTRHAAHTGAGADRPTPKSSRGPAAPPSDAAVPAIIKARASDTVPDEPVVVLQTAPEPAPLEEAMPVGSLGMVAMIVPPPPGMQGAAFTLPFPTGVGAAAFRREDVDYVVFDERRPLDLTALRHSKLLWNASMHLLPAATLIRLRLPPGMTIRLLPASQGWTVATVTNAPPPAPIDERVGDGRLTLAAAAPSQVVTLADPETGATLLVGTQHRPGQAVAVRRSGPEFTLLPSWQGVLVEALSDRLTLRTVPDGFVLGAEPGKLVLSPLDDDALSEAGALTRMFHFPDLPVDMLRHRITQRLDQAAAAPPLSRGPPRQAIARDMIALGLDAEAEALLHVAMQEDPKEAASLHTAALAAVAALLADRPEDAGALTDPRMPGSDEITFWRAVRLAARDDASPQAAASFAVTAPLALAYPPAMRDKLLPLVLETMLRGGQATAAQALLARCGKQPGLEMARAMADEAAGKVEAALSAYDAMAHGADQLASARAGVRALELRLQLGRISEQHAADGLDRLLYAWRGDRHDLALRERLAELRQQTGAWRAALTLLRNAEQDFPEQRTAIRARMQQTFAALLRSGAVDHLPPLELVALVDENADLLPQSADGEALQAHLADRLLALDLPQRAEPVLEKLMRAAPTATARAGFGARLAALRLHEGDAAGALQALLASAASGLPDDLAQRRLLLFAAATARRGDVTAAMAALAGLHSAAAASARADIMEQAQDWQGAERALTDYVSRIVPPTGALNDTQRQALLRLATAAARAGDDTALAGLHARDAARMGSGALADMFRLLTAPPVRRASDLARSRREAGFAQALPVDLKAVEPVAASH